jgi:hypothetical protein
MSNRAYAHAPPRGGLFREDKIMSTFLRDEDGVFVSPDFSYY